MLPSYCISLLGRGSRWDLFRKRAAKLQHLTVRRFPAIDCRERRYERWSVLIDPAAYRELQLVAASGQRQRHDQLTPGAVGCYLSHMNVLRKAYALNQDKVLIFEDDAVPPPNLIDLLQMQLDQLENKDWDILLLGYLSKEKPLLPEPLRLRKFYRTHAYVINSQGMAKVLALGFPLRKQFDSALSDWTERIAIYGAVPQLVDFDPTLPTTIQIPVKSK